MTGAIMAIALGALVNCKAPNVRKLQAEYCECLDMVKICQAIKGKDCKTETQCRERLRKER